MIGTSGRHGKSGLVDRVRASTVDEREAEMRTLEFLRQYVPVGQSPMCGNSICQDRRFMARWMPELEAYFHYRNMDVSRIRSLPGAGIRPSGASTKPRPIWCLQDIDDSIAELRFYRERLFVAPIRAEIQVSTGSPG